MGIENVAEEALTRSSAVAASKGWSGPAQLHLLGEAMLPVTAEVLEGFMLSQELPVLYVVLSWCVNRCSA